jgi:tetratricopeptide (TPR) repeat protein
MAYIIYKESNVYGAWRHLLFIYPPMVVLAAIGIQSILNLTTNRYLITGMVLAFAASLVSPASHIIRNYPNQYIYFNEIAGGVKKAYRKYETDYYMVSLKPGTDWIKKNLLAKADTLSPVKIVSNAPADIMNYYFRDFKNKVKLPYTRYYDRGMYDWDYAIFFCNYIDPYQINHNIWPPKNTIYNVTIDGVKICSVVKRENKDDYYGFKLLTEAIRERDRAKLDQSVQLMENALKLDKHNEITYLNLAQALIMKEEFDAARAKLTELLGFYPNYEKALNMIGYSYLNEGEIRHDYAKVDRAIAILNDVIRINYKFASGYHNLGLAYLIKGNDQEAFGYFQKSIDNNPNSKESYYMMANILERRGNPEKAAQVREYANSL